MKRLWKEKYYWFIAGFAMVAVAYLMGRYVRFEKEIVLDTDQTEDLSCISLSEGSYTLSVQYETVGNENKIVITPIPPNDNWLDYYHTILADEIVLYENKHQIDTNIRVYDNKNQFCLNVLQGGSEMPVIRNVRIVRNADILLRDNVVVVALSFMAALFLWLRNKGIAVQNRKIGFMLAAIAFIASLPLFTDYICMGHDLGFHLLRIEGIRNGLLNGQFPVRIQPGWLNGYGYATSVMYGDIFLYFPAVLRILGFSIQSAYKIYILCVNIATCLFSYIGIRKVVKDNNIALLGSALYTLSVYRFANMYIRSAVGEGTAMVFLPFIFAGLYLIFQNEDAKKDGREFYLL